MTFPNFLFGLICDRSLEGTSPRGSKNGIFTYIWLMFMVKVGEYTSPMDPLGKATPSFNDD